MNSLCILNEYTLLRIFSYLNIQELSRVSRVCQNWYYIANDDILWKNIFCQKFLKSKIPKKKSSNPTLPPASKSWKNELKRLIFSIPSGFKSEELIENPHCEEICNVCFSSDGKYFATCGRDSQIVLWDSKSKYPTNHTWARGGTPGPGIVGGRAF
jgi:WD40 repeat protein